MFGLGVGHQLQRSGQLGLLAQGQLVEPGGVVALHEVALAGQVVLERGQAGDLVAERLLELMQPDEAGPVRSLLARLWPVVAAGFARPGSTAEAAAPQEAQADVPEFAAENRPAPPLRRRVRFA